MDKTEINWDKIKFRASSWSNLMTEPQSKADKDAGKLSKTCQKELIKIYCQEIYGRKKDIKTNKMLKGTEGEEDSITLFGQVENKMFRKNEEPLENEWCKGHMDIYEGISVRQAISSWDIKTRWELETFMPKLVEEVDAGEYLQMQIYFELSGAEYGGIANTLIDCPIGILMEEKKKLLYSMNVATEFATEYLEAAAELERLLTFPDIDYRERVIKQEVRRDDEVIAKMKAKVPRMREWLQGFHKKHMNQYPKSIISPQII
jgi:hypothetical protein